MKIPKCDVGMYDPKGHPLNRMRAKKLKENGMVRLKSLLRVLAQYFVCGNLHFLQFSEFFIFYFVCGVLYFHRSIWYAIFVLCIRRRYSRVRIVLVCTRGFG